MCLILYHIIYMQVLHPYDNTLIEPKAVDNGLGNEYTLRQWMCPDPRCAECTRK